jgi:hypothetical protein
MRMVPYGRHRQRDLAIRRINACVELFPRHATPILPSGFQERLIFRVISNRLANQLTSQSPKPSYSLEQHEASQKERNDTSNDLPWLGPIRVSRSCRQVYHTQIYPQNRL